MLRDSTVPSTGARMRVWSRLSWAWASDRFILSDNGAGLTELVARHVDGLLRRIGGGLSGLDGSLAASTPARA